MPLSMNRLPSAAPDPHNTRKTVSRGIFLALVFLWCVHAYWPIFTEAIVRVKQAVEYRGYFDTMHSPGNVFFTAA